MLLMLKQVICAVAAVASMFAQEVAPPRDIPSILSILGGVAPIKGSGIGSITRNDIQKRAAVYCVNGHLIHGRNSVRNAVWASLGVTDDQSGIGYYDLDIAQYEILCEMFNLDNRSDQTMLILYYDKQAVQFPYDEGRNLAQELKKLDWVPLSERLNNFLLVKPNNQDALALLFIRNARALFDGKNTLDTDTHALPAIIDSLEKINRAGKLDWMHDTSISVGISIIGMAAKGFPALTGSREFQRELNKLLALIEDEMERYPFSSQYYFSWAAFANMARNPDPSKLLSRLAFPPGTRDVPWNLFTLAKPFFNNAIDSNDKKVDEGFKFLDELERWMDDQSSGKGDIFDRAILNLAMEKSRCLIRYAKFSEIEKYLDDMRYKLGKNWPTLTSAVSTYDRNRMVEAPNLDNINEILELPAIEEGEDRLDGMLVLHNFSRESIDKLNGSLAQQKPFFSARQDTRLPKNSWVLRNRNAQVAAGSIVPREGEDAGGISEEVNELLNAISAEERKNLNALAQFLRQNPENYDAMDMYCEEAAKFLPDELLETQILAYAAKTGSAPNFQTFSKMNNKDEWSRLASKTIAEHLAKLKDAPSFSLVSETKTPWINLCSWEDLDLQKNTVGWYDFFKDPDVFWYEPTYYMLPLSMPEVIFVKYITQAEKIGDMRAILRACDVRFSSDKKNCRNSQIISAWNRAEEKLQTH